ncbi:MAG TPA: multicopper oxidase domain-containing protein, partial [Candidatus Baltobacteraceae bacterium]|nr:multicopper oxidase domain-containing protein [Candidatus Baltobacteraceae bacterium]
LPPDTPASIPDGPLTIPYYAHPSMHAMEMRLRMRGSLPTTHSTQIDPMNNPHAFNTTNLHVHGIQTVPHLFDPVGTSDPHAMMIAIRPGSSFRYDFPIPPDHPSGLYWYHPHHHGATDVQVGGGMAGLLIVRGPIDDVPEIAAAREILLAIQTLELNPAPHDPRLLQFEFVAYQPPYPQGDGYNCAFDYMMVMVNGHPVSFVDYVYTKTRRARREAAVRFSQQPPPVYHLSPGEVVRLRMLQGTNFMFMPVTLPGMDVYVIGRDGVNLPAPQLLDQRHPVEVVDDKNLYAGTSIDMPPGSRAEMLIRAREPGTYTLRSVAVRGVADMYYPAIDLARFVVSGSRMQMAIPKELPIPTREYPLISKSDIVRTRTLQFSEASSTSILPGVAYLLDGHSYDETRIDWWPHIGTAEEWTLTNTSTEGHPFHIHVNSFEVLAVNGVPIPPTIRDVIWIPPAKGGVPSSVRLRIRFKEWTGKSVLHCHILPHEDLGMMQNLLLS